MSNSKASIFSKNMQCQLSILWNFRKNILMIFFLRQKHFQLFVYKIPYRRARAKVSCIQAFCLFKKPSLKADCIQDTLSSRAALGL